MDVTGHCMVINVSNFGEKLKEFNHV